VILDQLKHAGAYRKLGERFAVGFDYLITTDFAAVADGRYEIRGEDVYAMVQSYDTKPQSEGRWESHRRNADIQYVISGHERMGVAPIGGMKVQTPYDEKSDVAFFTGSGQFLRVNQGSFTIFLPHDVHMPTLAVDSPVAVKKVVVKVKLD
jgi:YhcH/YjgK/YiaL family protein